MLTISNSNFPNPLSPKIEKDKKSFGKLVAEAIITSTSEYREKRNAIFASNRAYAEGKQSMKPLLDMMEVDGQSVYTNISIKAGMYAKKFEKIVVDGYMEKKSEFPKVTALSKHIQERKDRRKSDTKFKMEYGDTLNQISQEAGVPLVDQDEFIPSSKEELDIYFDLEDKEKEELLMQETINFVFNEIDIKSLKRKMLTDQFQVNLTGLYEYIDNNGKEAVDYIQGEDCVYGSSFFDDFRDTTYSGRYVRMPLSKLRARFAVPIEDEKFIYDSLKKFTGKFGNRALPEWSDDYRFRDVRPYDNYTVEIFHCWWKCSKVIEYTEGTDRYGRTVFDTSYTLTDGDTKSDGRKKKGRTYPETAYEGYFLNGYEYCLEWKEQTSQLRDGANKQELINPFIFHMVDNHGGMLSPSAIESIKDDIQMMDLQKLKIKQVIAKTPPDGLAIDIKSLIGIDLGDGETEPLELIKIYRQTGDIYYASRDEEGNELQVPIRPTAAGLFDKINTFITVYNQHQNNIRDTLGINEFRDGSATSPRTGFKFAQAQNEASNTATISLYGAFVKSAEKLTRQIGIRVWDALKYGTEGKHYLRFLGEKNAELIKSRSEITQSIYDFKYELGIDAEEREYLEANIAACLANGTLELPDALLVRRTFDSSFALAERMLRFVYEKRRKQKLEEADANQKSAANYTAQAGVAVEESKQASVMAQLQFEQAKEKSRGDNDQIATLLKGAMELITQSFTTGVPIPQEYAPLVQLAISSAAGKAEISLAQTQQEQEAMAQQEEQQAIVEQIQGALQSGEIDEQTAQQMLAEAGIQP